MVKRERKLSEVLKRGYSDEELDHIYELGRWHLENGNAGKCKIIMSGIIAVAPEYWPAWLGLCAVLNLEGDTEGALNSARQALQLSPGLVEAELFVVSCLLSLGDYNGAGTFLGSIAEKIGSGAALNPDVVRYYRTQIVRYESRIRS